MSGLTKIIELEEEAPTGEPTVQILSQDQFYRIKTAGDIRDYLLTVRPEPGKTFILVLAMSAGEYYGPNRNGDAFPEKPIPGAIEPDEVLPKHYKTFEQHAHVFKHHQNKDPARSIGSVVKAFYNWDMHRVELLLKLDNEKAKDVVEKINSGKYPAVSMGCRVKYDVCARTDCHNKAPTRANYCDHIKYHLNDVDPVTGEQNFVWNPSPRLFDISVVIRPADRIAYTMKKVAFITTNNDTKPHLSAAAGEKVVEAHNKISRINKLSAIDKVIRGEIVASKDEFGKIKGFSESTLKEILKRTPDLTEEEIDKLSNYPFKEVVACLNEYNIPIRTTEWCNLLAKKAYQQFIPQDIQEKIAALSGGILTLVNKRPEILFAFEKEAQLFNDLTPTVVDEGLNEYVSKLAEKKSNNTEYLYKRALKDPDPSRGYWDPIQIQGPEGTFETTRGAVLRANKDQFWRRALGFLGSSALGALTYKILKDKGPYISVPASIGAGVAAKFLYNRYLDVPDIPGTNIPINTEMRKLNSTKTASSLDDIILIATEYYSCNKDPKYYTKLAKTLSNCNEVANWLYNLSIEQDETRQEKLASKIDKYIEYPKDSITTPKVNLNKICSIIGKAFV